MSRRSTLTSAAAVIAIAASAATAADLPRAIPAPPLPSLLPAVSAPNAKIGAFGGSIDGAHGWGALGAFSLPLHNQWGLQVDGLGGSAGGDTFWGAAGHLFWRNPTHGLLGLYASTVDWSGAGAEVRKLGVEAELYAGAWTLAGTLAAQSGTFSGIAGNLTAAFYLHDNFRLDARYQFLEGVGNIGGVGIEWQHNQSGLALFGSGNWGEHGYSTVIGGVKFYAGPRKSLVRRQREDDPEIIVPHDLEVAPPPPPPITTCN
jgi:hypothetical protein